jgi:hypothetical protein
MASIRRENKEKLKGLSVIRSGAFCDFRGRLFVSPGTHRSIAEEGFHAQIHTNYYNRDKQQDHNVGNHGQYSKV